MKPKKDIEVLIKVPSNWLDENELDFLTMLGNGIKGKVSDRVIDGAVEKILEKIELPKVKITSQEIKDRILDILANKALEKKIDET